MCVLVRNDTEINNNLKENSAGANKAKVAPMAWDFISRQGQRPKAYFVYGKGFETQHWNKRPDIREISDLRAFAKNKKGAGRRLAFAPLYTRFAFERWFCCDSAGIGFCQIKQTEPCGLLHDGEPEPCGR